ncbi:MAG TPA: DUF4124 domain-containing protein [Methylotenera sp.]|nr:DUF4124 domain-containing protein [Methylotenera sp.]
MIKHFTFFSILSVAFLLPQFAFAEIYKHVDADGRITYSNVKIKGAKKLALEPADTNFGTGSNSEGGSAKRSPAARTATPANFPKVDADQQSQRDGKRKEILQGELDAEKIALEEAKKAYAEGAAKPEVYKTKDGKTFRNVPKFEEKMKSLQADVNAHQRNIELLEKEITNIN